MSLIRTKATVTRTGSTITSIRFQQTWPSVDKQYRAILAELPDDAARRAWLASKQDLRVKEDGWVEVRPL